MFSWCSKVFCLEIVPTEEVPGVDEICPASATLCVIRDSGSEFADRGCVSPLLGRGLGFIDSLLFDTVNRMISVRLNSTRAFNNLYRQPFCWPHDWVSAFCT